MMGHSVMTDEPIALFCFLLSLNLSKSSWAPLAGRVPVASSMSSVRTASLKKDVDGSLLTGLSSLVLTNTFRKFCHNMLVNSHDCVYSHLKL